MAIVISRSDCAFSLYINPLAPDLFFLILAHPVY